MRIPLSQVGRHGRLDLTFTLQRGRTILRNSYCEVPFKITRLLNGHGQTAHLILMQCTAGLFGGDELECTIRIESGARVLLTQQSATKVHPSGGRPALQNMRVFVESGAELELYLEPVIPFAESLLKQSTHIEVQSGARLVFWEGLMAGRVGRGERWQFRELSSETQLSANNRLVFLDRFVLLPDGYERSALVMGDSSYVGTGLFVGNEAGIIATQLHEAMPEAGMDTPTSGITIARIVSATGLDFHRSRDIFYRLTSATGVADPAPPSPLPTTTGCPAPAAASHSRPEWHH